MRVTLPPLRDRAVDIPPLSRHLLAMARPGQRGTLRISDEAMSALERYRWPGNVRELELVLARAALLATDGVIEAVHLTLADAGPRPAAASRGDAGRSSAPSSSAPSSWAPSLGELERQHIAEVLERTGWHQGRAADLLGISPKTLYRKIREYGFKRPSGRNA
jgi:DNA-binding NtrC family response regulator